MGVVDAVLVAVPGKKCNRMLTYLMQGYYLKQRHTSGLRLFKVTQDYIITGRGHTETRYYSSDLVYLVYISAGMPCGRRAFSTGFTVGISWMRLRGCRVGVAMMAIAGVVGHNPIGVCSQKGDEALLGSSKHLG